MKQLFKKGKPEKWAPNRMDVLMNFGLVKDANIEKEVNLRVNTPTVTADIKLCERKLTRDWIPKAEFKISGNWVNDYLLYRLTSQDSSVYNSTLMASIKPDQNRIALIQKLKLLD